MTGNELLRLQQHAASNIEERNELRRQEHAVPNTEERNALRRQQNVASHPWNELLRQQYAANEQWNLQEAIPCVYINIV
jgi:hypothetical protein